MGSAAFVDGAERRAIIAVGAKLAAQKAGLTLIEDEGLLYENAGLTEWPMPLLGRFDPAFLDVPPEVIQRCRERIHRSGPTLARRNARLARRQELSVQVERQQQPGKLVRPRGGRWAAGRNRLRQAGTCALHGGQEGAGWRRRRLLGAIGTAVGQTAALGAGASDQCQGGLEVGVEPLGDWQWAGAPPVLRHDHAAARARPKQRRPPS